MVRSIQDPISIMNKSGACTLRERKREREGGEMVIEKCAGLMREKMRVLAFNYDHLGFGLGR